MKQSRTRFHAHVLTAVAVAAIAAAVMTGGGSAAIGAEPETTAMDGDYRYTHHWSTKYAHTDDDSGLEGRFETPTNGAFAADGSIYVVANYSSGSSPLIQHYSTTTGELIDSFSFAPVAQDGGSYYAFTATGIWVDSDGTVWVTGVGENSEGAVVSHFSAAGAEITRFSLAGHRSAAGLVKGADGRFYTVDSSSADPDLIAFDPSTGAVQTTSLPGAAAGFTAFQLNITGVGTLLWGTGDAIYTVNTDGSNLTSHLFDDDVSRSTIGADGRLYTVDGSGTIVVRDATDLDSPGTEIARAGTPAYLPTQPMSPTGVTAGADGVVYALGYFYGDTSPAQLFEPFSGVTALQQVHSPSVEASSAYDLVGCSAFTSPPLVGLGVPAPTWFTVVNGSLPEGLTLDNETGVISGTAEVAGTRTVSIRAFNGVSPSGSTTTTDTSVVTITTTLQSFIATAATLTGATTPGSTLTAHPGTWTPTPAGYSYQWLRDGRPVTDATDAVYVITKDDTAHAMSVAITGLSGCVSAATAVSQTLHIEAAAQLQSTAARNDRLASTGINDIGFIAAGGALLIIAGCVFVLRRRVKSRP